MNTFFGALCTAIVLFGLLQITAQLNESRIEVPVPKLLLRRLLSYLCALCEICNFILILSLQ